MVVRGVAIITVGGTVTPVMTPTIAPCTVQGGGAVVRGGSISGLHVFLSKLQ